MTIALCSTEKAADTPVAIPLYVTFSLAAFRILSLSLNFTILIIICFGVDLLGFILLGIHCTSYTWVSVSFFRFEKFSAIISSNIFSIAFSLFFFSGTTIMCKLVHFILSHRSPIFLLVFLICLSICCSNSLISSIIFSRSLICCSVSLFGYALLLGCF